MQHTHKTTLHTFSTTWNDFNIIYFFLKKKKKTNQLYIVTETFWLEGAFIIWNFRIDFWFFFFQLFYKK